MPDFGRAAADQPDPEAVAGTERFLDALAQRRPVEFSDPGDEVLAALLEEWRDESRWPPASGLVSDGEAVAALRSGATARRTRPGLAGVGSVAATVLCLGGFGAVVAGAHPGDAFYGLHIVLFGGPEVSDEQIALTAKTDLDNVQQMIVQGQWDQAQDKLAAVSNTVQTLNDADRKQGLLDQVKLLNAKVATRDPNATLPPGSPPTPSTPPTAATASPTRATTSAPAEPPAPGASATPTTPDPPASAD
jgi:hypothetical protein